MKRKKVNKTTKRKKNLNTPIFPDMLSNIGSGDVLKYTQVSILIFFILLLTLFTIHQANNKRIKINKLNEEIGKLRAEHTELKVQEVEQFKHANLLDEVKRMNLDYSEEPLKVIYYDKKGI